jgi:hypothetical protein
MTDGYFVFRSWSGQAYSRFEAAATISLPTRAALLCCPSTSYMVVRRLTASRNDVLVKSLFAKSCLSASVATSDAIRWQRLTGSRYLSSATAYVGIRNKSEGADGHTSFLHSRHIRHTDWGKKFTKTVLISFAVRQMLKQKKASTINNRKWI